MAACIFCARNFAFLFFLEASVLIGQFSLYGIYLESRVSKLYGALRKPYQVCLDGCLDSRPDGRLDGRPDCCRDDRLSRQDCRLDCCWDSREFSSAKPPSKSRNAFSLSVVLFNIEIGGRGGLTSKKTTCVFFVPRGPPF